MAFLPMPLELLFKGQERSNIVPFVEKHLLKCKGAVLLVISKKGFKHPQ